MQIKTGQVCRVFKARDGRSVTLRTPKWEDLDDLLEFINSLVEESADILVEEKQTRESEAEYLARILVAIEKGETIKIFGEVDGRVVANAEVDRHYSKCESHVGTLGIAIKSGYRGIGIGTEILKLLIEESRRRELRIITLHVFETNQRARSLYEKAGFKEVGRVQQGIFRGGRYLDDITMALMLEPKGKF